MTKTLVIDTHAWVWFAFAPDRLLVNVKNAMEAAEALLVSSVSIYEIGQKVSRDRWPGMDRSRLDTLIEDDEHHQIIALTPDIARRASLMDWPHRDPFDRIIAATALELAAPLISRDPVFDKVNGLTRSWGGRVSRPA